MIITDVFTLSFQMQSLSLCLTSFEVLLVRKLSMPPRIPISSLLNEPDSSEVLRDVQSHVALVSGLLSRPNPLSMPPEIEHCLSRVVGYLGLKSQEISINRGVPFTCDPVPSSIKHNVKLNRQTTLATLYIYEDIDTYLEYPETGTIRPVGHLFRRDPHNWENPIQCFAYSLGKPSGQSMRREEVVCPLLRAEDGTEVPCIESHSTCTFLEDFSIKFVQIEMHLRLGQGVKACPMSDIESMKAVHVSASREDIKARLHRDRQQHIDNMSPTRDIFEKTFAFISALHLNGCQAPLCEPTVLSAREEDIRSAFAFHKSRMQRGYIPLKKKCEGRLYLLYTVEGVPYIQ